MSDAIKVYVRVRPPAGNDTLGGGDTCLSVDTTRNAIIVQGKPDAKVFTYDNVADTDATQESVFSYVGKSLIDSCLDGYNGTVFAYGQTGSGKTFTMVGPSEGSDNFHHDLRGVIPRTFEYLFNHINRQQELHGSNITFLCRCTFLEIYNETVYDLLDSAATSGLQLRENMKSGVFVDGLLEQTVTSAVDAYNVLSAGWMNRTVAATSMNRESSRSHAVFTVHIESKMMQDGVSKVKSSQLNLVDLAGSERQRDTHTAGVRLKEAGSINKSLSALGNVIMALVDVAHGKARHVPYRDSKLTFLLRDSLGGNAKTYMITCVHPGFKCLGETLSTLQFARRAKMIKNKAVVNEDMQGSVANLQAEIRKLRELLQQCQLQHGGVTGSNSGGGAVVPATPSRVPRGIPTATPRRATRPAGTGSSASSSLSSMAHVPASAATVSSSDIASGLASSTSEWKNNFLQAMYFREKALADIRSLEEKYSRLEDTSKRHDQALRQTRMVLKFREAEIKRLKDKMQLQDRSDNYDEEAKQTIDSLKAEVHALQSIIEHHPDLVTVSLQSANLKAELTKLKSTGAASSCMAIDAQRVQELVEIFTELNAKSTAAGDSGSLPRTPQPTADSTAANAAAVQKHKQQVTKLQTDMDKMKEEHTQKVSAIQKELLDAQSSLAAVQKSKQKLEEVLKSYQLRANIEREAKQDVHAENMRSVTTPTKVIHRLRARSVYVSGSRVTSPYTSPSLAHSRSFLQSPPVFDESPLARSDDSTVSAQSSTPNSAQGSVPKPAQSSTPNAAQSSTTNEAAKPADTNTFTSTPPPTFIKVDKQEADTSGITDEVTPTMILEDTIRSLVEDLNSTKNELKQMQMDREEQDMELVRLVEQTGKLQTQKEQLEQQIIDEKQSWSAKHEEVVSRITELQAQLTAQADEKHLLESEVCDLRVMSQSDYKHLQEVKQENVTVKASKEAVLVQMEELQNKTMKLEVDADRIQRELNSMSEVNITLKDTVESLQAQLDITTDKLGSVSEQNVSHEQTITDLHVRLQTITTQLAKEVETNQQLMEQLKEQGVKEKELAYAFEHISQLQNELRQAESLTDEQANKLTELDTQIAELTTQLVNAAQQQYEKQEAMNTLHQQLSDSRSEKRSLENQLVSLTSQLNERQDEAGKLNEQLTQLNERYALLGAQTQARIAEQQAEIERKTVEYNTLCEDMKEQIERTGAAIQDCEALQLENTQLQAQIADAHSTVSSVNSMLAEKDYELMTCKTHYESRLDDLQSQFEPKDETISTLQVELVHKDEELTRRETNLQQLQLLCETHEVEIVKLTKEMQQYQSNSQTAAELQQQLADSQATRQTVEQQVEVLIQEHHEREQQLLDELLELQARADYADGEAEQLQTQINDLTDQLDVQIVDNMTKDEQIARYQRTSQKDDEKVQDLSSQVEDLNEKFSRISKKYKDLEAKYHEEQKTNVKLAGHQNHQQKIQHIMSLKQQIGSLETSNTRLRGDINRYRSRCDQLESVLRTNNIPVTPLRSMKPLPAAGKQGAALPGAAGSKSLPASPLSTDTANSAGALPLSPHPLPTPGRVHATPITKLTQPKAFKSHVTERKGPLVKCESKENLKL